MSRRKSTGGPLFSKLASHRPASESSPVEEPTAAHAAPPPYATARLASVNSALMDTFLLCWTLSDHLTCDRAASEGIPGFYIRPSAATRIESFHCNDTLNG